MPRFKADITRQMRDLAEWSGRAECTRHDASLFDTVMANTTMTGPGFSVKRVTTVIDDGVITARGICGGCPVMMECLRHSVKFGVPDGVWGGLVVEERVAWAARAGVVAA
jgi:Transcription factor WhiB